MVLQLAVPHVSLDSSASTSKLPELPITPDYVHHAVPAILSPYSSQQKRNTATSSNTEIQQDLFSSLQVQKPISHQFVYVNQGLDLSSSEIGIPDQSQLTVTETASLGAIPGVLDEREKETPDPPPTPPEEKVKMFRQQPSLAEQFKTMLRSGVVSFHDNAWSHTATQLKICNKWKVSDLARVMSHLTVILSCVYAVFVVTLGVVIYISDIVLQSTPLAETFSIYLVILGLVYFLFLYTDIRKYTNGIKNRNTLLSNKDDMSFKGSIECQTSTRSELRLNLPLPKKLEEIRLMQHYYCFSSGRHSGSFYLKVGAAGFCFGHLIHSGLLLGYQIVFLTSDTEDFYNCASIATLILDIVYPVYSFLQLFFIFKYSNVIINRCKELARFALMHCIASSLCFWIWTIMRETMDSLSTFINHKYDKVASEEHTIKDENSSDKLVALPLTFYQKSGARTLVNCVNDTSWVHRNCQPPHGLAIIADNFSPYLYPFSIEYSILVVGILFIIWQKIGQCAPSHGESERLSECPLSLGTIEEIGSNLVIHADCQSSNKGLFAGLIILVGSVTSIILFFIAMADKEYVEMGLAVNATSELILLLLMTIAVILAYRKLTQLDINHHPVSLLDGLLLFICIPAHFLYAIFSIIPAVLKANYVSITNILLQVVQVLLQTPFIIDGLRRCSNTRALRIKKPGRELVTFLVVCNVALWITETFEIKSHDKRDDRDDVYGRVLWTMLSHMTVPLTMFYRFHSSVCLVDIWKSAYEPGEQHKPKA